jgi:hypothetical protein
MSRRYAIFDQAHLGPQLDVTRGGIVLTTLVPSLGIARTGRLTVPAQDFESFAEFIVYGNAGTAVSNRISIGVVTADAELDDYVGADEYGVGYRLGEGQIHHDGSSIESATVGALGDVIGVRFTPGEAGAGVVTWYRNGVQVADADLPAELEGQPLFLACSLGSDLEPGDLEIMVNSGRDNFWYPVAGPGAGWWDTPPLIGTLRFGEQPYITSRDETIPYVRYEGGITGTSVQDVRGVNFWIWGDGRSANGSAAVLDILDSEGRLDGALGLVYRDQPASLRLVDPETGVDAGVDLGQFVIERIEAKGPITRKVTLKGPLAAFEVPMLRLAIRPDADPDAVGHYYPMLIGPAFSCPVRLIRQADALYALDAIGTNAISKVRDNGRALDISAPDYILRPGGREVELLNAPYGTVTVDAAGTGVSYVPPGAPDVLDGDGNFSVGLDGWTVVASGPDAPTVAGGGLYFWATQSGRIRHDSAVLQAGHTYRVSITVRQMGQRPYYMTSVHLAQSDSQHGSRWWSVRGRAIGADGIESGGIVYQEPHTFDLLYTPPVTHPFVIGWGDLSPMSSDLTGVISNVSVVEMPAPEDAGEDEADAEIAALARPLEDMLRQGIETRCTLSPDVWDAASAAAVDTHSGFAGQGFWAREQLKLSEYVDLLLAPYTASAYETKEGKLAIARLLDPDTSPLTGVDITESDILNDLLPEADEMRGLTCSIGCRKNEHVFSADELSDALPWAARPKLTNDYRYTRIYSGPLAVGLEHARAAPTLDSRLVIPEDAQAAIDYAGQLASKARCFFDVKVPRPDRWEVAQVCRMYSKRWFGGWRNVYITRITNGRQDIGTLLVWTRAPWEQ